MFLKMRVIDGLELKNGICMYNNTRDCYLVKAIYLLWIYWFGLLNLKIFQLVKSIIL